MTTERTINYEVLAQDAMRGVMRTILTDVAKNGLPGDHHFYISFDTLAVGVGMSKRLKEKYPEEMTIVLQHRFWDLAVTDERFEVKLTFDGIPERLVVPFRAIKVFFDPSVRYGLQFEAPDAAAADAAPAGAELESSEPSPGQGSGSISHVRTSRTAAERRLKAPRKPRGDQPDGPVPAGEAATPKPAPAGEPAAVPAAAKSPAKPKLVVKQSGERSEGAPDGETPGAGTPARPAGAQVVSLDAFRKK